MSCPYLLLKLLNPGSVVRAAFDFGELRRITHVSPMIYLYCAECLLDFRFWRDLRKTIRRAESECRDPALGGWMSEKCAVVIYALVRHYKPVVMVETGVGPGGTSRFILAALHRNKSGTLYSIDLPGNDKIEYPKRGKMFNTHVPIGYEVGWLVPAVYRRRWELIIGDSKIELPLLTKRVAKIDTFLHDSLHTDEHVRFEFDTVLPNLSRGALLLADDVNPYWSLAFIDWCSENGLRHTVLGKRLGVAKAKIDASLSATT
jgi:hypothetical protein